MNSGLPGDLGATSDQKSIQEYIDETPVWRDGTILRTTPMTGILIGTSLLGAAVTRAFQIETAGINLETIGK